MYQIKWEFCGNWVHMIIVIQVTITNWYQRRYTQEIQNFGYFLLHACMCNFSNLRNFTNKQDEISKNYNIEIWSKWKLQDSAAISWTKIIAEYCNIHLIKTQIEFFEAPSSFHTTSETDIHCWRQSTKVLESSIVSH